MKFARYAKHLFAGSSQTAIGSEFDESYYASNGQLDDRPALWFFERLARSFISQGRILDFGCGTGFFLKRLNKHFPVDGYELGQFAREKAQSLIPSANIFQRLEDVPSNAYAGITSVHVLEHISDDDLNIILSTWRRALIQNGRVLCVIPDPSGRGHRIKGDDWYGFRDPTHINLKSRLEWQTFFAERGFKVIRVGADGLRDFPYTNGFLK